MSSMGNISVRLVESGPPRRTPGSGEEAYLFWRVLFFAGQSVTGGISVKSHRGILRAGLPVPAKNLVDFGKNPGGGLSFRPAPNRA